MMGAYIILFCVQWVAGMAIEIYYQIWQRADNSLAGAALEILKESGAIGTGAAANSIAIALMLEGIMVLAQMLRKQQEAEARRQGREEGITLGREQGITQGREEGITLGITQGREEGITEERHRKNEELRAWAKEKGIPLKDVPIDDD